MTIIYWTETIPTKVGKYLTKKDGCISETTITFKDLATQEEDPSYLSGIDYYSDEPIEESWNL